MDSIETVGNLYEKLNQRIIETVQKHKVIQSDSNLNHPEFIQDIYQNKSSNQLQQNNNNIDNSYLQQQIQQQKQHLINDENQEYSDSVYGLTSLDNNELIEYWLSKNDRLISRLPNEEYTLQALYSEYKYTQKNIKTNLNCFQFLKCLGRGGTSEVFLVRHRGSCKIYALKMMKKTHLSDFKRLEQLLRERKILIETQKNEFVAQLHACFESDFHLNFLLEYYPGGELFYHLQNIRLTEQQSKFFFAEIIICFENLHQQKILYRDLKPENIVLDVNGHLRLTDFGLSKIGMQDDEVTDSFCGSPEYMPPEILQRVGYNYSVDFYTIGAFLYELVTGLPPYYDESTEKILKNIQNHELTVPDYLSQNLRELLFTLLIKDVDKRVQSFDTIKNNPWLQDIQWDQMINKELKPPINIDLKQSYIHPEFSQVEMPSTECNSNEDLFSFFAYTSPYTQPFQNNDQILQQQYNITQQNDTNNNTLNSNLQLKLNTLEERLQTTLSESNNELDHQLQVSHLMINTTQSNHKYPMFANNQPQQQQQQYLQQQQQQQILNDPNQIQLSYLQTDKTETQQTCESPNTYCFSKVNLSNSDNQYMKKILENKSLKTNNKGKNNSYNSRMFLQLQNNSNNYNLAEIFNTHQQQNQMQSEINLYQNNKKQTQKTDQLKLQQDINNQESEQKNKKILSKSLTKIPNNNSNGTRTNPSSQSSSNNATFQQQRQQQKKKSSVKTYQTTDIMQQKQQKPKNNSQTNNIYQQKKSQQQSQQSQQSKQSQLTNSFKSFKKDLYNQFVKVSTDQSKNNSSNNRFSGQNINSQKQKKSAKNNIKSTQQLQQQQPKIQLAPQTTQNIKTTNNITSITPTIQSFSNQNQSCKTKKNKIIESFRCSRNIAMDDNAKTDLDQQDHKQRVITDTQEGQQHSLDPKITSIGNYVSDIKRFSSQQQKEFLSKQQNLVYMTLNPQKNGQSTNNLVKQNINLNNYIQEKRNSIQQQSQKPQTGNNDLQQTNESVLSNMNQNKTFKQQQQQQQLQKERKSLENNSKQNPIKNAYPYYSQQQSCSPQPQQIQQQKKQKQQQQKQQWKNLLAQSTKNIPSNIQPEDIKLSNFDQKKIKEIISQNLKSQFTSPTIKQNTKKIITSSSASQQQKIISSSTNKKYPISQKQSIQNSGKGSPLRYSVDTLKENKKLLNQYNNNTNNNNQYNINSFVKSINSPQTKLKLNNNLKKTNQNLSLNKDKKQQQCSSKNSQNTTTIQNPNVFQSHQSLNNFFKKKGQISSQTLIKHFMNQGLQQKNHSISNQNLRNSKVMIQQKNNMDMQQQQQEIDKENCNPNDYMYGL